MGVARWIALAAVGLGAATPAMAMQVIGSRPAAEEVMQGGMTSVFVRFDGPVDHASAMLELRQAGRVVQVLHARLNSQPNVLYAAARRLPPGEYSLHWTARSMREGHETAMGEISFRVQ